MSCDMTQHDTSHLIITHANANANANANARLIFDLIRFFCFHHLEPRTSTSPMPSFYHFIRTMSTSLLSLSSKTYKQSKPIVKIYSLHHHELNLLGRKKSNNNNNNNNNNNLRIIHFLRHAEGYHNVNKDYKSPLHIDAMLTPKGIEQCKSLSKEIGGESKSNNNNNNKRWLNDIDCIISSPMRRAIQTAKYTFEDHVWMVNHENNENDKDDSCSSEGKGKDADADAITTRKRRNKKVPFIACEEWRETVNYLCDQRISSTQLRQDYPFVNFDYIQSIHDPIWEYYENKHGAHDAFQNIRESNDDDGLRKRARKAWEFINDISMVPVVDVDDADADTDEGDEGEDLDGTSNRSTSRSTSTCSGFKNIVVVSHSAFFMHMFTRPELGVVSYEDEEVKDLMTSTYFENCEVRSMAFEIVPS